MSEQKIYEVDGFIMGVVDEEPPSPPAEDDDE
jgi:hypothetical protein